jgi:hypothetical protein
VTGQLSDWQAARLAVLLDVLDGISLSDGERGSPRPGVGLGEADTVENFAAVIRSSRGCAGEIEHLGLWIAEVCGLLETLSV